MLQLNNYILWQFKVAENLNDCFIILLSAMLFFISVIFLLVITKISRMKIYNWIFKQTLAFLDALLNSLNSASLEEQLLSSLTLPGDGTKHWNESEIKEFCSHRHLKDVALHCFWDLSDQLLSTLNLDAFQIAYYNC